MAMTTEDILLLGAAGVGVYLIVSHKEAPPAPTPTKEKDKGIAGDITDLIETGGEALAGVIADLLPVGM